MIDAIDRFMEKSIHSNLLVVVIMAHGLGGSILGRDGSLLEVQRVLNALNKKEDQIKVH